MPADVPAESGTTSRTTAPQVGLQMWTVREQMAADAIGCIEEVGRAGFTGVELVGYGDVGYERVRDHLQDNGMTAISQHVPYRRFAGEFDQLLAEMVGFGSSFVVIQQARPGDFADADSVAAFARTCNDWGRRFADAGIALGYHGYHDLTQEFAPDDGRGERNDGESVRTRFDRFTELTDPELVFLQLDTYWVRETGHDPAALLARYRTRVPSLHLKDAATGPEMDTTVGDGLMDLPGILAAARSCHTRWVFIEQEGAPTRAFSDIRRSRSNILRALGSS